MCMQVYKRLTGAVIFTNRPHCCSVNCGHRGLSSKDMASLLLSPRASWLSPDFTILVCSLFWQHASSFPPFTPVFPSKRRAVCSPVTVRNPFFLSTCVFPVFPDFALIPSLLGSQCLLACLLFRLHCPQLSSYCRKAGQPTHTWFAKCRSQ